MTRYRKTFLFVLASILVCCFTILLFIFLQNNKSEQSPAGVDYSSTNSQSATSETNSYNNELSVSVDTDNDASVNKIYFEKIKSINKQDDRVLATVNSEPIYASEVQKRKASLEAAINSNLSRMDEFDSKERQEYIDKYSKTDVEILKDLSRDKVVIQNAIKSGIEISESDVYKQAKYEIDTLKATDIEFYNNTLDAYNMDEEECIKKIYMPDVRNRALWSQFKMNYFKDKDVSDADKVNQEYEEYIDKLVEQAVIQYK